MKKFLFLILTLAYFTSTSGATIYFHQCMGKTIAWDLKANENNDCGECGMHKNAPDPCCGDHVKVLKIQDGHQLPVAFLKQIQVPVMALPAVSFTLLEPQLLSAINETSLSITPLRSSKTNYCILYCTFLI
ncbi:MAG: hypothetical protein ABIR03_13795 [Ginsengibacter sp.]